MKKAKNIVESPWNNNIKKHNAKYENLLTSTNIVICFANFVNVVLSLHK